MNNQYSIAKPSHHTAEIAHKAENGQKVPDLWAAIPAFRASHDLAKIADEDFANLRDPSAGREFSWET